MGPHRLHVLIVDAPVYRHVIAEVGSVGPLTLDRPNLCSIAVSHTAIAGDVTDQ